MAFALINKLISEWSFLVFYLDHSIMMVDYIWHRNSRTFVSGMIRSNYFKSESSPDPATNCETMNPEYSRSF